MVAKMFSLKAAFSTESCIPAEMLDDWKKLGWRAYFFSAYALSSLSFAAFGLYYLLWFGGEGGVREALLWIGQSVVCYGNDVWSFGKKSVWNPTDRIYAWTMMLHFSYRYVIVDGLFRSIYSTILFATCILMAAGTRILAARALGRKHMHDFLFYHGAWHAVPLVTGVLATRMGLYP